MEFFAWSPEYSVGIDEIDEQHKRLVSLINQLHHAKVTMQTQDEVYAILTELLDYTRLHFKQEEALLAHHGYPLLREHKEAHYDLVMEVLEMNARFWSADEGLADSVLNFLKNWLRGHILSEDKKYAAFLAEKRSQ